MTGGPALLLDAAAALWLFVLPGLAMLEISPSLRKLDLPSRIGLAAGLSVSIIPILFLAGDVFGFRTGRALVAAPGAIGLAVLAFRSSRAHARLRLPPEGQVFMILTASLFLVRMAVLGDIVAPAWGDSVHHTTIVQLMLDHGGLFRSWAPYAPMTSFTYHFGFHADAASWAILRGVSASAAVLAVGQVLNVLAILAIYPFALLLTGSAWAALAALSIAGFLSPLPAFFINWGRYTQLAGQVILPAALAFAIRFWRDGRRGVREVWPLGLLWAGMFLTHYRVLIVLGAGTLVFASVTLAGRRREWKAWLERWPGFSIPIVAAGVVVLPWILNLWRGGLPTMIDGMMRRSEGAVVPASDLEIWTRLDFYYWPVLLAAGSAALLWALWRRRREMAGGLVGWFLLSFLLANPHLLRLPGGNLESNAVVVFALYIPLGILIGWAAPAAVQLAARFVPDRVILFWALALTLLIGGGKQLRIVDPFYQMITPNDVEALRWVRETVPPGSRFLTNGFLAYGGSSVVGSDAGWWLPLYSKRESWLPSLMYRTERLRPGFDRDDPVRIAKEVPAALASPGGLAALCRREGLTHLYLGEKRGTVGFGASELLPEEAVRNGGGFSLVFEKGRSQVWRRDDGPDPRQRAARARSSASGTGLPRGSSGWSPPGRPRLR
jgi:hypothetical protein